MADIAPASRVPEIPLVASRLRTPRAAAIAGIIFSILLMLSFWLLRTSIPSSPTGPGIWLQTNTRRVLLALNLIPFAGVSFMWFLGVLRDRLGAMEDRFFATVFLGSGILFLGMTFVAASAVGSLVLVRSRLTPVDQSALVFGRAFSYEIMHTYAYKMAVVFMIATSTLVIRTGIAARWIALAGYAAAVLILLVAVDFEWVMFAFSCWVLLVSIYILIDNLSHTDRTFPSKTMH